MASFHGLKDENLNLEILNRQGVRVSETSLLGMTFTDVKDIANAFSGVSYTLRKFRHFTDFHGHYLEKKHHNDCYNSGENLRQNGAF